jgi:hypothetical protein
MASSKARSATPQPRAATLTRPTSLELGQTFGSVRDVPSRVPLASAGGLGAAGLFPAALLDVGLAGANSQVLGDQTGLKRAQRHLQEQLLNLRTITEDMLADQIVGSSPTRLDQVTLAIDELAMLASACRSAGRGQPGQPPRR